MLSYISLKVYTNFGTLPADWTTVLEFLRQDTFEISPWKRAFQQLQYQ